MEKEALFEKLAAIEHERWADWQKYLHSKCKRTSDGALIIPADRVEWWERQIKTPYSELSETEKHADRQEVKKYWDLIYGIPDPRAELFKELESFIHDEDLERVKEIMMSYRIRVIKIEDCLDEQKTKRNSSLALTTNDQK